MHWNLSQNEKEYFSGKTGIIAHADKDMCDLFEDVMNELGMEIRKIFYEIEYDNPDKFVHNNEKADEIHLGYIKNINKNTDREAISESELRRILSDFSEEKKDVDYFFFGRVDVNRFSKTTIDLHDKSRLFAKNSILVDSGYSSFLTNQVEYLFRVPFKVGELPIELKKIDKSHKKPEFPHCYILVGLTGSGKSTMISHMLKSFDYTRQGTKVTTRPLRFGIKENGIESVAEKKFVYLDNVGELIGVRKYKGNYYGHSIREIKEAREKRNDIFLDMGDLASALEIKKAFPKHYVKIIALESNPKSNLARLMMRENIWDYSGQEMMKKEKDIEERVKDIFKKRNEQENMMANADFILQDDKLYGNRYHALFNYILSNRFNILFEKQPKLWRQR